MHQLIEHLLGGGRRDGKTNAQRRAARRARINRGVDADHVAVDIHQRATGVAGVDRRIGLNEIFKGVDAEMTARQRADNAERHRLPDAEWIADRQHQIADLRLIGLAEGNRRQLRQIDLDDREIGIGIGADHFGFGTAVVSERDFDFIRRFNHVRVGEDVTFFTDDDAGTKVAAFLRRAPSLSLSFAVAFAAEEITEHRVVHKRCALCFDFLAGVNIHHRRHRALGRFAE